MDDKSRVLSTVVSERMRQILEMLKKGMYPDEIAKALRVSPQAVYQRLASLREIGLVEARTTATSSSRPRFTYRVTPEGDEFLQRIDDAVDDFSKALENATEKRQLELDDMLIFGKITEAEYLQRRARLSPFKESGDGAAHERSLKNQ